MRRQNHKRFNPSLTPPNQPSEIQYPFSLWPLLWVALTLLLAGTFIPNPEQRGLSSEVIQNQNKYHDQTCEELHRLTYTLRQVLDRYESIEDPIRKENVWVNANRLNAERNIIIQNYRDSLRRQVVAGNVQIHDLEKVCRFSSIYLEPVSLVARH